MKQGDIYQTILKDGRSGAARVLKTGGKFDFSPYDFYLIGITSYIDIASPKIDDKRVNKILVRDTLYPKGFPVIYIYCGEFSKECKFIGNLPLTKDEEKLKIRIGDGTNEGFPLCGKIPNDIGYEVLNEWRYKYDTEAYLKEMEMARQQHEQLMRKLRSDKPKKMLSDEKFWNIIKLLDWIHKEDNDKVLEPAVKELSKLKISEIKQFEETMSYKLFQLDTKEHAKNIGEASYNEKDNYVSVDFFLYARCAAVANGEKFYQNALNHPSEMPKDIDFEALLTLSFIAYELKTGKEFDYDTGISYETYSNSKGWE